MPRAAPRQLRSPNGGHRRHDGQGRKIFRVRRGRSCIGISDGLGADRDMTEARSRGRGFRQLPMLTAGTAWGGTERLVLASVDLVASTAGSRRAQARSSGGLESRMTWSPDDQRCFASRGSWVRVPSSPPMSPLLRRSDTEGSGPSEGLDDARREPEQALRRVSRPRSPRRNSVARGVEATVDCSARGGAGEV